MPVDLQKIFETVSGKELSVFFDQWLYTAENPSLQIDWKYDALQKNMACTITQQTTRNFVLPLELRIHTANGGSRVEKISVRDKITTATFPLPASPLTIEADPNCILLAETVVKKLSSD